MGRYIRKELASSTTGFERNEMYAEIDTKNGNAFIVVKKTITERMNAINIKDAEELFEAIALKDGRIIRSIRDLAAEI